MINLFEDITKKAVPTAEVIYDINDFTNSDVTAKLVNESTKITITNNDGKDTYVFKENGNFTFEFVDENGNKGSALASVNWIDKISPTATITYDITEETNGPVTATLSGFSEKVTIVNNSGSDTYIFTENGEFTFEFVDEAGNIGTATATVNWIKEESENPNEGENPDDGQNPDEGEKPDDGQSKDEENDKLNDIEKDDTIANGNLPQTGTNNIVLFILCGVGILAIIFYIKMRKISKKQKHL